MTNQNDARPKEQSFFLLHYIKATPALEICINNVKRNET